MCIECVVDRIMPPFLRFPRKMLNPNPRTFEYVGLNAEESKVAGGMKVLVC